MKLSLPAMQSGAASGPAAGADGAATGLTALLAGGEDGTVRPMEEALAFASLLLEAGSRSPGKVLPDAGESGGKVLPDGVAAGRDDVDPDAAVLLEGTLAIDGVVPGAADASAERDASADGDALAALVSLLQAGSRPRGGEFVAPPANTAGQRADANAPITRAFDPTGPGFRSAQGGAGIAIADAQFAKGADMALPEVPEAKPPQRPTADAMALLRSAGSGIEPGVGSAAETLRPTGDVRGLSAALLGAQPAQQAAADAGSITADRALVTVRSPFGGEQWADSFAERVGWVVNKRLGNAEVRLNPAHLGPVEVSIRIDEEQARVTFSAAHPATREAIEQAVPRLREMLAQQGLELRQTDVGDFASGHHGDPRPGDTAADSGDRAAADGGLDPDLAAHDGADRDGHDGQGGRVAGQGLIDTFV